MATDEQLINALSDAAEERGLKLKYYELFTILENLKASGQTTRAAARRAIEDRAPSTAAPAERAARTKVPRERSPRETAPAPTPVERESVEPDLLGEFLAGARRKELSGVEGMSTRELFSALRGMQRQDVAGTRLAGLANTIRAAFTKDRTVSKYERKEPEAPEMTAKDKLKLGDIERALKDLAANKQKIIEGDLDAAETLRKVMKDLVAASENALQTRATTGGRRAAAQLKVQEGRLTQANKAVDEFGFGELTDPDTKRYQGKTDAERVEIATARKYRPAATAELILTADNPEDLKTAIFGRIDASSTDKAGDLTDNTRLKEAIEAEVVLGQKNRGMMYVGSDSTDRIKSALQDAVLTPGTVVVYAPDYVDGEIVDYVPLEVDDKADLDFVLDNAGEGARIGLAPDVAQRIGANLFNPDKILNSAQFVLEQAMKTYAVLGAEEEVEELRVLTDALSGLPGKPIPEQMRAIAGLDPIKMQEKLDKIKTERADLFKEAPTTPRPVTKQTLQQEIARRQMEFGRARGGVMPDNFYRQTYRRAAKEGRGTVPFRQIGRADEAIRQQLKKRRQEEEDEAETKEILSTIQVGKARPDE